MITSTGDFCSYLAQGVCQRFLHLSWIKLQFRRFRTGLVLFWTPLPGSPQQKEKVKANMHPFFFPLSSSCVTDTDILANFFWALRALKSRIQQRILFLSLFLFYFFPPWERKRPRVFAWETHIDRRLPVQTNGKGRETPPRQPILSTDLCWKFFVKVVVKLDSWIPCVELFFLLLSEFCWLQGILLCYLSASMSRKYRRWVAGIFFKAVIFYSCAYKCDRQA